MGHNGLFCVIILFFNPIGHFGPLRPFRWCKVGRSFFSAGQPEWPIATAELKFLGCFSTPRKDNTFTLLVEYTLVFVAVKICQIIVYQLSVNQFKFYGCHSMRSIVLGLWKINWFFANFEWKAYHIILQDVIFCNL